MVHVLTVEAVVAHPFLCPVRRVIGAVHIQQDPGWGTVPATRPDVEVHQGGGQPLGAVAVDGVLQAGERRLAGEVGAALRPPSTDQLQERVRAQRIGVILVFVAAGDLEDTLAQEGREPVSDRAAAPVRDAARQAVAQPQRGIGLR